MPNTAGLSPKDPNKYLGPNVYVNIAVTRPRRPTGADYRQPETGNLYAGGTLWQVGKNPSTGVEGEIWFLSKIVANVATWLQLDPSLLEVGAFQVDAVTPPGVNPVVPDSNGLVIMTGAQVASATIGANVIRSFSSALNTITYQIQQTGIAASKNTTLNGVAHFNSAQFTVDEGFISLVSTVLQWIDSSGTFNAAINTGYFLTAASTVTLPSSAVQGTVVRIVCDTTDSCVVTANTGQSIRNSNNISSVAGTATNTLRGDSLELVFRASTSTWFTVASPNGGWNLA